MSIRGWLTRHRRSPEVLAAPVPARRLGPGEVACVHCAATATRDEYGRVPYGWFTFPDTGLLCTACTAPTVAAVGDAWARSNARHTGR